MSASGGALEAIERILDRGSDADDVLRDVVAALHSDYVVGRDLVRRGRRARARPARWESRPASRRRIPISYENSVVAELGVIVGEIGA